MMFTVCCKWLINSSINIIWMTIKKVAIAVYKPLQLLNILFVNNFNVRQQ